MSKHHLPLTPAQRSDLLAAVRLRRNTWATYAPYLDPIHRTLRHADLLPADDWADRATIGSTLHLRRPDAIHPDRLTLALPRDGESPGRLSVLTPLGWELLGARPRDIVHAATPEGLDTYLVERIDHPARRTNLHPTPA